MTESQYHPLVTLLSLIILSLIDSAAQPSLPQPLWSSARTCNGGASFETERCLQIFIFYLLFIIILNSSDIEINKFMFTSVARPTVGIKRFDSCFLPMQQYHKSLLSGLQFGTCVSGTRHCVPQGTHHIQGPNTSFLL